MIVTPIKTALVKPNEKSLMELLDESIKELADASIVAITSKVVSLCEGRVAPIEGTDKEELVKKESSYWLPQTLSKYGYHFTIKDSSLTSNAGIDESNSADCYVLWPADSQKTANDVRAYLKEKFGLKKVGVVITDSTTMPMRRGTVGTPLAYSGFKPITNYIGTPDLFGREFKVSRGGVAIGLAAAAVFAMGEGTEQTPIVIISDASLVHFVDRNPSQEELDEEFYIADYKDDLYEPFIGNADWQKGGKTP